MENEKNLDAIEDELADIASGLRRLMNSDDSFDVLVISRRKEHTQSTEGAVMKTVKTTRETAAVTSETTMVKSQVGAITSSSWDELWAANESKKGTSSMPADKMPVIKQVAAVPPTAAETSTADVSICARKKLVAKRRLIRQKDGHILKEDKEMVAVAPVAPVMPVAPATPTMLDMPVAPIVPRDAMSARRKWVAKRRPRCGRNNGLSQGVQTNREAMPYSVTTPSSAPLYDAGTLTALKAWKKVVSGRRRRNNKRTGGCQAGEIDNEDVQEEVERENSDAQVICSKGESNGNGREVRSKTKYSCSSREEEKSCKDEGESGNDENEGKNVQGESGKDDGKDSNKSEDNGKAEEESSKDKRANGERIEENVQDKGDISNDKGETESDSDGKEIIEDERESGESNQEEDNSNNESSNGQGESGTDERENSEDEGDIGEDEEATDTIDEGKSKEEEDDNDDDHRTKDDEGSSKDGREDDKDEDGKTIGKDGEGSGKESDEKCEGEEEESEDDEVELNFGKHYDWCDFVNSLDSLDFISFLARGSRCALLDIIATMLQNYEWAQNKVRSKGWLFTFISILKNDSDDRVRIKALYAISCAVRDHADNRRDFLDNYDGLGVLVRAIQTDVPKLQIKSIFLLNSIVTCEPSACETFHSGRHGIVELLVSIAFCQNRVNYAADDDFENDKVDVNDNNGANNDDSESLVALCFSALLSLATSNAECLVQIRRFVSPLRATQERIQRGESRVSDEETDAEELFRLIDGGDDVDAISLCHYEDETNAKELFRLVEGGDDEGDDVDAISLYH